MEGESVVTRSIIDENHFWDIQQDQIKGESGVNRCMISSSFLGYPRR